MSDDKLRVEITADSTGIKTGMAEAKSAVQDALSGMESTFKDAEGAISGSITGMTNKLMELAPAALAAAAAFAGFDAAKSALEGFSGYAGGVERLSETLGISTEKASMLSGTLKVLGMSSEEYMGIIMRLERQIKSNTDIYDQLGIKIRDVNTGAFLPTTDILDNVIEKMKEYRAGSDQIQFA
ncbi:MAG TPA: hypothetical protein HPP57_07455, partial [Deltaproteobacteria bacterium]|nr:hypothetical protein [Deltaproteobacteria bacterium]